MMPKNSSTPMIIGLLLYVASFGCLYAFWHWQLPAYMQVKTDEVQKIAEKTVKQTAVTQLDTAANQLDGKKKDLSTLDIAVPSASDGIPIMLLQMQGLADRAGVTMANFAPSLQTSGKSVPVSVSVTGPLSSIRNYIDALYLNLRLITTTSINWSSQENNGAITVQLQGTTILASDAGTPAATSSLTAQPAPAANNIVP